MKNLQKQNETETKKIDLKRKRNDSDEESEMSEGKKQFLSLKQAKFDVFKFGIKGFSKEEQESAKIKLAMKLGAAVSFRCCNFFNLTTPANHSNVKQPPKNKTLNYKELIELKKNEKNEIETLKKENKQFEAKIAMSHSNLSAYKKKSAKHPNSNSQRKAKISRGDVGHIKGHIGSFNNGVLKIKNNVLKNLKK